MSVRLTSSLICLFVIFNYGDSEPVSFINKCKPEDNKCLKQSISAAIPKYAPGVPELNIAPLDPLHINKVDASSSGLKLVITDVTFNGIKHCKVKNAKRDLEQSKLIVKAQCDIDIDGQYEMGGTLLLLPVDGKGAVHAKLRALVINLEADMDVNTGKDGKSYWNIKKWSHSFTLKEKADVNFEGLFPGSVELRTAIQDLISSSPNEILLEVGPPVVKAALTAVVKSVQKFFHSVPYEDLVETQ